MATTLASSEHDPPATELHTGTGPKRLFVSPSPVSVPSPSCPKALEPQQRTVPSARSAQVWSAPAAIAVTLSSPGTVTGERSLARVAAEPTPICPLKFLPQHFTVPLSMRAQVWPLPVVIATALLTF